MIHLIFTVFDDKSEAYLQPFFLQTKGQAIRTFSDCVNDINHQFGRHPGDYTLFQIGTFNDQDCSFDNLLTPLSLGKGVEYVQKPSADLFQPSTELEN